MRTSEFADWHELEPLRDDWDRLVLRMELPSPFQLWTWNRVWWQHFGANRRLRVLTFHESAELAGVAQLQECHYGWGAVGSTVLAPLGWEDHHRRQGMTEQNELIVPACHRGPVLDALAAWLEGRRWSALLLPGFEHTAAMPAALTRRIVLEGKPNSFFGRGLPATYPDFVAQLGKSMRDNVKYYPRLLERHGRTVELRVSESADDVIPALHTFLKLHRARAQTDASSVTHRDKFAWKDRRAFLLDVGARLAGAGVMKVGVLHVDGEPVAAQIWFELSGAAFLYYTGWDPAWAKYSVQLVATIECLKRCIDSGMRRVEFLRGAATGEDQRNERWGTERRTRVNLTLARRSGAVRLMLRPNAVRRRLRLVGTTVVAP